MGADAQFFLAIGVMPAIYSTALYFLYVIDFRKESVEVQAYLRFSRWCFFSVVFFFGIGSLGLVVKLLLLSHTHSGLLGVAHLEPYLALLVSFGMIHLVASYLFIHFQRATIAEARDRAWREQPTKRKR